MIRRITTKTRGKREADTLRIVQAFIKSRKTYAIPYAHLSKAETEKVNVIIRKAYKQALGLPVSTVSDKLLKLGLHNTADDHTALYVRPYDLPTST